MICLYEMFKIEKSIDTESRFVVAQLYIDLKIYLLKNNIISNIFFLILGGYYLPITHNL